MNEPEGLRFRRLNRPQVITDETHEPQHKSTSTYSGKVFLVTLLALVAFLLFPLLVVIFLLESPIQPDAFSLNEPPLMTGCYEPNLKLRQAERLFEEQVFGPESIANIGEALYTGTADGKIVKIEGRNIHVLTTLGKPQCGWSEGSGRYFTHLVPYQANQASERDEGRLRKVVRQFTGSCPSYVWEEGCAVVEFSQLPSTPTEQPRPSSRGRRSSATWKRRNWPLTARGERAPSRPPGAVRAAARGRGDPYQPLKCGGV